MGKPDLKQVKAIFGEALEKEGAEREAYLAQACGTDLELRAEIEAFLASSDEPDALQGGIASAAASDPDTTLIGQKAAVAEKPGVRVGRYKLLEQIGEGGFGVVFMAEQERPVIRRVALKIIKLGMDTRQVIARFEAERQALAMMDHPNIAKVLDAGCTQTGRPYFVMELVRGIPITEFCDANMFTTGQRLHLFVQVCLAVQHAHQKGIIHRDLKPSNVLVTLHDDKPVPKVIDFGIAKATQFRLTEKTLFTEFRQFIGTPQYTSPEQAQFSGLDIDTRSDIYSLGVLLYELLTSTTPLDAATLRKGTLEDVQRMIRDADPPRPSTRLSSLGPTLATVASKRRVDPARLPRLVRGELDWIAMKCLEKDRTRRYETANGLAADVRRYLADEPVLARPATAGYRFRKFIRRHKMPVLGMTTILATLLLGGIGTTAGMFQARAAQRETLKQKETVEGLLSDVRRAQGAAEREAQRAKAANGFLQNMLGSPKPGQEGGGRDVKVVDILEKAAATLDRLENEPTLEMDARLTLGNTYGGLGLHESAVEQLERAHLLARLVYGPESEQCIHAISQLVWEMTECRWSTKSKVMAIENANVARRVLGEKHELTQEALISLGTTLRKCGDDRGAEEIFRSLVEMKRHSQDPSTARLSACLVELAITLEHQGRLGEAQAAYEESARLIAIPQSPGGANTLRTRMNLAENARLHLELDRAEHLYAELLKDDRQLLGEHHPETIQVTDQLASLLEQRDRYEDALPLRRKLLEHYQAGSVQQAIAETLYRIGQLEHRCGSDLFARRDLSEAISRLFTLYGGERTEWRNAWSQAALELGIGTDQTWASNAIRDEVSELLRGEINARLREVRPLGDFDGSRIQFAILRWNGANSPATPIAEGGRKELVALPDPEPGVYLLKLTVPWPEQRALVAVGWMLAAPWKVCFYRAIGLDFRNSAEFAKIVANPALATQQHATLCFNHYGYLARSFGPMGCREGFAVTADAKVKLPPGRYRITLNDSWYRLIIPPDPGFPYGTVTMDSDGVSLLSGEPRELRVESASYELIHLTAEPVGDAASEMVLSARSGTVLFENEIRQLDAELVDQPNSAYRYANRANYLMRAGRFPAAAEDLNQAIALGPISDHLDWLQRACVLAYLNDVDGYRNNCEGARAIFGHSDVRRVCHNVVAGSVLLPLSEKDAAALQELMDRALARGDTPQRDQFELTQGILAYRSNRFEEAIRWLDQSVESGLRRHALRAMTADLFKNMSNIKLRREELARVALLDVFKRMDANLPKAGERDLGPDVQDWIICQMARREAERLLQDPTPATQPALARP